MTHRHDEPTEDPGMAALIRDARSGWNAPPETPRDEIWNGIEARLFATSDIRAPAERGFSWPWLAAAAVAVLLMGVGIGRVSLTPTGATVTVAEAPAAAPSRTASSAPVRMAAAAHLTSTETLLTLVRADARRGELDPAVGRWGRRLLTETRLLLDSPAVTDPALRTLLEELEVVLGQVALLADPSVSDERRRNELELIADGLDEAGVEGRLRASLPALTSGLAETD